MPALITVDKHRTFSRPTIMSSILQLNIRNLFDMIPISEKIIMIKARLKYQNKEFDVTKIASNKTINPDIYKIHFRYYNALVVVMQIEGRIDIEQYITITFFENGKYLVKVNWGENSDVSFKETFEILDANVNPFINQINKMNEVFDSTERLNNMTPGNSEFTNINISLFWKKAMVDSVFQKIISHPLW